MQSKLVENWLTNAKELSFTPPFVQLLIYEGYTVLQPKGGPTEQGKDVIARDPEGNLCAFQLKCGDIGSSEWQSIRAQLDDLTEIPPIHPAITSKPVSWNCYLVTNGDITGQVSRTITDYSAAKKDQGKMSLHTVSKEELLRRFSDCFGEFLPAEPNEIRIFFELFCEAGDNILKRKEYKQFFERFLLGVESKSKQKKVEALQASLVLSSYLLTNKYADENYVAILDGWVLTLLNILYFADKWNVKLKTIELSEKVILDEIHNIWNLVANDITSHPRGLVDTTYGAFSEPFLIYRLRCAELLGYLSAGLNFDKLAGYPVPVLNDTLADRISLLLKHKMLVSEIAMGGQYNTAVLSALNGASDNTVVELKALVESVLSAHRDNGSGLVSPYYLATEAISHILGIAPIRESFHNRSYTLWPAVLLLAKYNQRAFLNDNWRELSQISMEEVVASKPNDLLLWEVDAADLVGTYPDAQQSWGKLQEEANSSQAEKIPSVLIGREYLIPFMIIAMPHRLTPALVMHLARQS